MILLIGEAEIFKTILTLVAASKYPQVSDIKNFNQIPNNYRNFLNNYCKINCATDKTEPSVVTDPNRQEMLKHRFSQRQELDDLRQDEVIEEHRYLDTIQITHKVRLASDWLKQHSPLHFKIYNLAITDILVAASTRARAGSVSTAPGCVWIGDICEYANWEVAEILVHELIHTLVFLDENRHSHYDYRLISNSENNSISSILNIPRPVDKAFHSIIVAIELIKFRNLTKQNLKSNRVHPPTATLLHQVRKSITDLQKLVEREPAILTPRAKALLALSKETVLNLYSTHEMPHAF